MYDAPQPDTEYLPRAARTSRAELDALRWTGDIHGIGLTAGSANVVMQLALPAVGYGVYESRVDSGNLFKHPIKRTRTTLTYIAVATMGSPEDRKAYRRAVGRAHAQVRSTESSPVEYNAFDPKLQLWVAACMYKGLEDIARTYGDESAITEDLYRQGALMGTTLQMPLEMWPATRADFEEYWQETVASLEIDPVIRDHLKSIGRAEFMGPLFTRLFGWWFEILTIGFLPPEFRDKMDYTFRPWQRLLFTAHNRIARFVARYLPKPLAEFPYNVLLTDVRWRMRTGRPLV
ncbi:hypothetical protein GS4_05_02820 [Gordonia soli NBRC 108243]|uniref:ER-bound oxygenase mpaB/mpaB'/Rubber oxygenase catalytic domain-containing protein n=1 Tax=Gordonia soli NBRC 108243 TaxID=1223545 RepID=M0QF38_9ACTN|nr:oxygenase MpaB family protein [Gordonia soli]GAC67069.1 hypothetical protein GS4_05_02820 [Gordonia soli NBRC 108243]